VSLRSQRQPGGPARPSSAIFVVLAAMGTLYLAFVLLHEPRFMVAHLALTPRRALGPEPWQLLTSGLVHLRLGALLSTAIAFYFFGAPVEAQLGRARLVRLLVISTIVGSLAEAALGRLLAPNAVVAGAGPASLALLAAFGAVYRDTPISLFGVQTMKASTCAIVFIGISALFYLMNVDLIGLAGGAAGVAVGTLAGGRALDGIRAAPRRWRERLRRWRIRRRYRVIPGGRDRRTYLH
jgi:membrane associated rhomboid family serine protease